MRLGWAVSGSPIRVRMGDYRTAPPPDDGRLVHRPYRRTSRMRKPFSLVARSVGQP